MSVPAAAAALHNLGQPQPGAQHLPHPEPEVWGWQLLSSEMCPCCARCWASSNTEREVLSSGLQPGEEGAPPAAVSCLQAHRAPSSAAEDAAGLEDDL